MINNYFHKIYYINLDIDTEKKQYFDTEISKSSLSSSCTRFPGVCGQNLDIRLINKNIITNSARLDIISKQQKTYGISLTYGSLGCALSHKLIFDECANSNKPFLIFEDDIVLANNFDNKLNDLITFVTTNNLYFDIVYLGYNEIPGFNKTPINNVISKPSGLITGTYGYIISNTGAKKLLNNIFPLSIQIDSSISHNLNKLIIYCSTTKLVSVTNIFKSRTQKKYSCINNIGLNEDLWYKLFR